jgi:hypothetical protein
VPCSLLVSVWWSSCPILDAMVTSCFIFINRSNLLWLVSIYQRFSLICAWLGLANELKVPAVWLVSDRGLKRDCFGNRLFGWFLGLWLGWLFRCFWYLLGSITCKMFQSCSEGLVIVDWIKLIFMKQDLYCHQVHMLPIYRSYPVLMHSALHSRHRGGSCDIQVVRQLDTKLGEY